MATPDKETKTDPVKVSGSKKRKEKKSKEVESYDVAQYVAKTARLQFDKLSIDVDLKHGQACVWCVGRGVGVGLCC